MIKTGDTMMAGPWMVRVKSLDAIRESALVRPVKPDGHEYDEPWTVAVCVLRPVSKHNPDAVATLQGGRTRRDHRSL